MKTKYYRYTLQGEHSVEDAQRTLGDAVSDSLIVRVDNAGGKTHVYVASQGTGAAKSPTTAGVKAEEVSEGDVTKIG